MMRPFGAIPGPKCYPLIGSLGHYLFGPYSRLKYHEALAAMHKEFGPLVKETIGPEKDIVHVFNPDDIKKVRIKQAFCLYIFTSTPCLAIKSKT